MINDQLTETLVITQEECAEVIQEISKIFRFGIDEMHKSGIVHRRKLEMEVGIISQSGLDLAKEHKKNKLKIWSNIFKEEAE
jgi:hypothetical protein